MTKWIFCSRSLSYIRRDFWTHSLSSRLSTTEWNKRTIKPSFCLLQLSNKNLMACPVGMKSGQRSWTKKCQSIASIIRDLWTHLRFNSYVKLLLFYMWDNILFVYTLFLFFIRFTEFAWLPENFGSLSICFFTSSGNNEYAFSHEFPSWEREELELVSLLPEDCLITDSLPSVFGDREIWTEIRI